jgi:hypothetical protein
MRIQECEPGTGRLLTLLEKAMDSWPLWAVDAALDEMEQRVVGYFEPASVRPDFLALYQENPRQGKNPGGREFREDWAYAG